MSNYRRLISYIYAYEGGVKGKNIGFAKLETRNGQCRIQVSVRKVFLGGQDMGVYLLSSGGEIFLGRIFLRNGAGEFRTSVAVDHVAGSDKSIDQCYGMTIHNMDDSWQNYTTIWEDAVAHAAEVELEEAVSELAEEQEMSHAPESVISGEKLEEVVTNHKSSIVESIEAEIQAQSQKKESPLSGQSTEEEIPSTFVQPRKEEPQKILWPKEEAEKGVEESPGDREPSMEPEGSLQTPPQEQVDPGISSQAPIQSHMQNHTEDHTAPELPSMEQIPDKTDGGEEESVKESIPGTTSQGVMADGQLLDSLAKETSSQNQQPGIPIQEQKAQNTTRSANTQSQGQPIRKVGFQGQSRQQPFQGYFSRRPVHGMPQQDQYYPPMTQVQPAVTPIQPTTQPIQGHPVQEQLLQPVGNPANWSQQQQNVPEKEDSKEGIDMESLWQRFCRTYPKIQAFDYEGTSEILTIKPQDIGLLPREIWTYGNNSFLLHGYYNHRYLILARLITPNGGIRFLLGVPGHYYSNEKYMASMFGFPNFVMSKAQPSGDNRFGYWYTDLRLGF